MILYFWVHWFWITIGMHTVDGDLTVTLSSFATILYLRTNVPNVTEHNSKAIEVENFSLSDGGLPSNTIVTPVSDEIINHPSEKSDIFTNSSVNRMFSHKKLSVITQNSNITNVVSSDQTLIDAAVTPMNHSDNITLGEVIYNQSVIPSSERIGIQTEHSGNLNAASITGITLGCVLFFGLVCGGSYILYRNRRFNRPQVLNDRCSNPDSSGYIDDASVRDNSEEMYSLDNDSFLNSLEAMTIQNYWTDTVKHTKL